MSDIMKRVLQDGSMIMRPPGFHCWRCGSPQVTARVILKGQEFIGAELLCRQCTFTQPVPLVIIGAPDEEGQHGDN